MDFTLTKYRQLLQAYKDAGYQSLTVEEYALSAINCQLSIILRHDVDLRPDYSLKTAQMEAEMGMRATYYFRIGKESNQPEYIRQIVALGHEIGYHYEDLSLTNGDRAQAYQLFQEHLAYFRQFYPVKTICMHGAPTSTYDGRDLWQEFDYQSLGVIAEPYLDFDYAHLFYLTDTGRQWDGFRVSLRDTIPAYYKKWVEQGLHFHKTEDIILALQSGFMAQHAPVILMTTHPQRWTNNVWPWLKEAILQPTKNIIKYILKGIRKC